MHTTQVAEFARQMLDAYGDRAALQAAQKMHDAQARGDRQEAESWRRIKAAIHELRPPHAS